MPRVTTKKPSARSTSGTLSETELDLLQNYVEILEQRRIRLTKQLDAEQYERMKLVFERLGGVYVPGRKQFAFNLDPTPLLAQVIALKQIPKANPLDFYYSPPQVVDAVLDTVAFGPLMEILLDEHERSGRPIRVLEPEAGLGHLADALRARYPMATIDVCEIDPYRRAVLVSKGYTVVAEDFLQYHPPMTITHPENNHTPDDEDAHEEALRLPSSTRRYASNSQANLVSHMQKDASPIRRKSRLSSPSSPTPEFMHARPVPRRRPHPLLLLGTGLLIMLLGWLLLSAVLSWWQITQDDWHYGRPRTFQTDNVVGHHDSAAHPSHFIVLNLDRHILIIELSGGDPSLTHLYTGPVLTGDGQDLAPVTLTFRDVTGDGKPDMIIQVQGSRFVLVNDQGLFRPANPGEIKTAVS